MTETRKIPLTLDSMDAYMALFGLNDQNVALVEQECGVAVSLRGSELFLTGEAEDAALAESVILKLLEMIRRGDLVDRTRIRYAIALAREGDVDRIDEILRSVVAITHRGKQIRCKTLGRMCPGARSRWAASSCRSPACGKSGMNVKLRNKIGQMRK